MDIRARIKKKISGEIDAEEEFKKYEQSIVDKQREETKVSNSNLSLWDRSRTPTSEDNVLPTAKSNTLPTYFNGKNNKQEEKQEKTQTTTKSMWDRTREFQTPTDNNSVLENLSNMDNGKKNMMIDLMTNNQEERNKLNLDLIKYEQEKDAKERANQINNDIANGDYSSAIGHILSGVPQKALDSTSTTFASMNSLVAPKKINKSIVDENELLKANRILTSKYEDTTSQIDNDIVKTASNVSGTIGSMAPSILANIALPGSGAIVQGVNVGADAYQDTLNEDASNKAQATATGIVKGTISGLIEKITGGNLIGKGSLDDIATNFIASKFKGKTGQWLASKAYEIIGEIGEENLENQAGYIIDKIINNKDLPNFQKWWNEAGETTKNTFLTTIVLNLLGLGGSTYNDVKNAELDLQAQKYIKEAENIIKNENLQNTTTNLQQNQANNNNNLQTQQTIQEANKVAQNQMSEQINNNLANNQETLYNNNESESGINEGIYSRTNGRDGRIENEIANQRGQTENTGISTKNISEGFKENRQRSYEEFIEYANKNKIELDTVESEKIRKIANNLGLNVILFNGDGNSDYIGMTDKQNPNNVYIDMKQKEIRGEDMLYHEFLHSRKRNNDSVYIDKIAPIEQDIVDNYTDIINNFIEEKGLDERYKNYPELIAEEIIADYTSKHLGNLEIDYDLPQFYVESINQAVDEMTNNVRNSNIEKAPTAENNVLPTAKKKLNPTEIANLKMEDANTTPELKQKHYEKGNRQSSFFSNIVTDAKFLNEDLRQEMSQDENIRYYKGITNAETLEKAYTDLQKGGQNETLKWFNKENKDISAEDVVKGWILLKQYQDSGDYQGAVEVAKKMRNMGTKAGQAVQAYNILSRLTPEGMFYYAQSELSEAYNKMAEGKSIEWIEDNRRKFDLTPEETQIIKEKMESIQGIEDERTKKIALAEIQKIITDKIPPTASQSIKSWMRISMLFNPKTQVRNIAGNATILPVNMASDFIASGIDRAISKKTGVRTTGNTNLKNYTKGFRKGLYESYDDFKRGINTRNIEGNRFEVTEGKNFKDKGIGKALNRVDNMLSFMLDAGDRGFYEATFTNSINNQLVLNNTTEVTQDMIDIATQEALQRTWQDNNTYTNAVLKIRKLLNFNKGYGLGDVLIPFAKTPANLTKAIIDYSPVGLTKTLAVDARKLNNSLQNGQYTPQLQHKFVQDLGKGIAGSFLYVLGYALAKAGVITGEADDDKDVKNFMKNSLGINSYSIKIGDKSFAYDWAQPVATPFAIMTNFEKYNRENPDASAIDKAINSINIGSEQLLQQSFMESINTVLNGNGTFIENLSQAILELPSRAVPTLSKQVTDMVDGTQRTSFEYGKPVESAINSVKAKIPGLSQTLAPSVDTLGNEIQKYGGDNNIWNVMFNPANMNKGQLSKAGEEIYNVYMETGDATLLPRTAPYYIDSKGEKKTMTSKQRSEFQKITGKYVENTINGLLNNKDYKKLSSDKKAKLINEIVSDSYSKAKYEVLDIDSEQYKKLRNTFKNVSTTSYYDYKCKTEEVKKDSEKIEVLVNANYTNKEKQALYESYIKSNEDEKYEIIKSTDLNINSYLKYKLADSNGEFSSDKKDDGTVNGKSILGTAKNKRWNYIENIEGASYTQKLILYALEYEPDTNSQKQQVINYVKTLPGKTNQEKLDIMSKFKGVTIYKDGTLNW